MKGLQYRAYEMLIMRHYNKKHLSILIFITFLLPLHRQFAKRVLKQYENIRVVKEPTECRMRSGPTRKWARQMG